MSFTTQFTPDGLGVIQVGEGVVTGAEMIAHTMEISRTAERMKAIRYGFVDLARTTRLDVTPAQVRAIAEEGAKVAALVSSGVTVAVAASSDHVYGVARMWEFHSDGNGLETWVFRDRAAALAWLRERCPGAVPDEPP